MACAAGVCAALLLRTLMRHMHASAAAFATSVVRHRVPDQAALAGMLLTISLRNHIYFMNLSHLVSERFMKYLSQRGSCIGGMTSAPV